jgi:hypothetical protein
MCQQRTNQTGGTVTSCKLQHSRPYRRAQLILCTFHCFECSQLIYIELCTFLTVLVCSGLYCYWRFVIHWHFTGSLPRVLPYIYRFSSLIWVRQFEWQSVCRSAFFCYLIYWPRCPICYLGRENWGPTWCQWQYDMSLIDAQGHVKSSQTILLQTQAEDLLMFIKG